MPAAASESPFDRQFHDFCRELQIDPGLTTTSATIATEFQRLFQSDRSWVLVPTGSGYTGSGYSVIAVNGIPSFQRRAEVVRKLEDLVGLVARSKETFRWSAGEPIGSSSPRIQKSLDAYLDESHVCSLRIEPLTAADLGKSKEGSTSTTPIVGIVICEWFQPPQLTFEDGQWIAARRQAGLALQNAADWSRAPFAKLLRGWRRTRSWRFMTGWTGVIAVAGVILLLAALIPIEFTIDSHGELQPVRRRHVFATSAGIVRELSVSSGTEVSEGTTLLEMDSPDLELEIRRAEGDLLTTEKRIASIEASRLDFGSTSTDSASQMNSLAGELQELRQKKENLGRELELLSQRRTELKVVSPIKGRVATWDVERLLSRRPVSRGQRLLTISDTAGPWELELRVNDEDTSDLFAAMKDNKTPSLDFVIITAPERVHSTKLKSVSETVELRSQGEPPSLLCQADVPENLSTAAVEGMSVRGRIHCGRRPAAVVVFGKLWRMIREYVLFPWGF